MKLAIEIIKSEISQRELANQHNHLRKDEVNDELESLRKSLSMLESDNVMVKKINETIELKERQLEEVLTYIVLYYNGNSNYTIEELNKNKHEINSQILILNHLLI